MIVSEELMTFAVWSAFCFCLGVAWAAYRAVGWADRIRTWANTTVIEDETEQPAGGAPEGYPRAPGGLVTP